MVLRNTEDGRYQVKKGALATVEGPKGEVIWERQQVYLYDATDETRQRVDTYLDGLGTIVFATKTAVDKEVASIAKQFGIRPSLREHAESH